MTPEQRADNSAEDLDTLHTELTIEATKLHMNVNEYLAYLEKKEREDLQDDSFTLAD